MSTNSNPTHKNESDGDPRRDAALCRNPVCEEKLGENPHRDLDGPLCDECYEFSKRTATVLCLRSDCLSILSTKRIFSVFCSKACQDEHCTGISDMCTCVECNIPLTHNQCSKGYCASHGGRIIPSEDALAMMWNTLNNL